MNTQLINQIKALPGVKEVQTIGNMHGDNGVVIVVVFEPRKPVQYDEYGVPLFEGDNYWWVNVTKGAYINLFEVNTPTKTITIDHPFNFPHVKLFSTPESAKKWIDEHKKLKPIYTDPEDGTEFFEGDICWWFRKDNYDIRQLNFDDIMHIERKEGERSSKIYKSRQLCELALAKFIQDKYK